jgi:hypothetical protein
MKIYNNEEEDDYGFFCDLEKGSPGYPKQYVYLGNRQRDYTIVHETEIYHKYRTFDNEIEEKKTDQNLFVVITYGTTVIILFYYYIKFG